MDRNTAFNDGELFPVPCERAVVIGAGNVVCVNADGYAIPGGKGAGYRVVGVSDDAVDNSIGAQGERSILVRRAKAFYLDNSATAPITQADVGKPCYLQDSVTVTQSDADNAPLAGRVLTVSADEGVQVLFN
ncbi:MAG: hypothetical protein ACRC9O_09615 [Plesiomonas sp.]|uniref:hypothetical protein n=1 Tax=Plesiomonas sp. TaxID=2486279 RepID=UPI003F3783E6